MSDYIVEMKHIIKRFPGIIANDDVTLGIKKGEVFALLGENGAGKSTLMSILFGMYEPDFGEIFIRGKKVAITSPNHAAKLNIGMVHQHFKLVPDYTIAENIVMGQEPIRHFLGFLPYVDKKVASNQIKELSTRFGLEVDPDKRIDEVSVSVRQRVEILKMLYRDAEILIFDEPTAVLTPQEIDFLLQIIENLKADGKTIILITHKLQEIKKVADRCAVMCRGKLTGIYDMKTTPINELARHMVGREVELELKKQKPKFGENVLEVSGLTVFNQENFPVVDGVSFSIRKGEILAIAGVAGNGQIEIADAIYGMMPVKKGTIKLNGKDITTESIKNRIKAGISYIPEDRQEEGLILNFSLENNLVLKSYTAPPILNKGILNREEIEKKAKDLIKRYDIRCANGTKTVVRSMSGGNQQKAIIARELDMPSSLIIFVQPTRGLDVGAIENIHRQMIHERDNGKAILLISLELDEVMNCADTIAVIYNGAINTIAEAHTLTATEIGQYMMGAKENEADKR